MTEKKAKTKDKVVVPKENIDEQISLTETLEKQPPVKKPPKRTKDKEAIAARKKGKQEEIKRQASEAANQKQKRALAYLKAWKKSPEEWRFQKIPHTWLLKNWKATDKISEKKFKRLLKYLGALNNNSGAVKRLETQAKAVIDTQEEEDTTDLYKRARQILQWIE